MLLWTLLSSASAAPHRVVLETLPTPDQADLMREDLVLPDGDSLELLVEVDGTLRRVSELHATSAPPPQKEAGDHRSIPVKHAGRWAGHLAGRAVYVSQCHGYRYAGSSFTTQRSTLHETVEDFHNPEGANVFLIPYLENAGADVFAVKERDLNPEQVIVDDADADYTEKGAGFVGGAAGWQTRAVLQYGENPFSLGTTRRFPANGGGKATWRPDIPADGFYAVYVSWADGADNVGDAHYRIRHPGGVIDRHFDQRVHYGTWQYVESLWLPAGTGQLTVELLGDSGSSGMLSADAVRVGGGVSKVARFGKTIDEPRWTEGAIYAAQYNGAPSTVYDPGPDSDGDGHDSFTRSRWASWEHPVGEDAVYLSWHSNAVASATKARGTVVYAPDCSTNHPGSSDFADLLSDELADSFHTLWDPAWNDRGVNYKCFNELNYSENPEMPLALVEMAFHDQVDDAWHLKEPRFRQDASRAMYRAIVRYFAERDGVSPHYLPEPPTALSITQDALGFVLSWKPGPSGAPLGDPATSWVVFTSSDGYSWDGGTEVTGTTTHLEAEPGDMRFVRVAGRNAGGLSFASRVVGARHTRGLAPVLVVDAFDRLDQGLLEDTLAPGTSATGGTSTLVRFDPRRTNAGDIVVPHGLAIDAAGWGFDSVDDDALGRVPLDDYLVVVWATGEESTADESVSTAQQALLRDYLDGGGALWLSGAEVLWDLDHRGSTDDQAFADDVLHARMASDAATTNAVDGEGVLAGAPPLDFGTSYGGPYPVEFPDTLDTTAPVIARYADGAVAGVLQDGVAVFGFPFDAIAREDSRAEVARRLLEALAPGYSPPGPGDTDDTGDTGLVDTDLPVDTDREGTGPKEDRVEPGGCGCKVVGPAGVGGLLPWILLVAARRRRG